MQASFSFKMQAVVLLLSLQRRQRLLRWLKSANFALHKVDCLQSCNNSNYHAEQRQSDRVVVVTMQ